MQTADKTDANEKTISDIYSLLGYHLSAYETYKKLVNPKNKKDIKKLYVLEEKSKTHGNNFTLKDIRKFRKKNKQSDFSLTDFKNDSTDKEKFLVEKKIVIFNKILNPEKFELWVYGDNKFEDFYNVIIEYLNWLCDCENELINFYNKEQSKYYPQKANKDWFDTLDIYNVRVIIGVNGKLFAEISGGDEFLSDHILDIEIAEKEITGMNYDG